MEIKQFKADQTILLMQIIKVEAKLNMLLEQKIADPEERKKSYVENLRKVILSFADENPEIISPSSMEAFFQSILQETKDKS